MSQAALPAEGSRRRALALLMASPTGAIGLAIVLFFLLLALCAPLIAPHGAIAVSAEDVLKGPSARFLFGTDGNGMDVFSRVLYGARYAFGIAVPVLLLGMALGVPIGLYAGYRGGWFDEMPLTTMRQIIEVNVWGVIVGTRVALPLLRNTQRALVMSTASVVATHGHALRAVYSASKFAVRGLTEALSLEFERFGIRTADVLPGCIDTPMLRGSLSSEPDGAFDVRLFDNLPKEGAFRVMPASAIADAVWNAYHGDVVHWYVPEEVGDIDRLKGTDYAAARESTRAFLFDRGRR